VDLVKNKQPKAHWKRWWLAMWALVVVGLIVGTIVLPWQVFLPLFVFGFGVPEAIGLMKDKDPYPPLTHVLRHFVYGWIAFPLLFGLLGSFGAKALAFPRWWAVGLLFAGLGWITHHFVMTYLNPDPGADDDGGDARPSYNPTAD
jgi:hypothetical protein